MNIYVLDSETTEWNLIDDYIELKLVEILNCENDSFHECITQDDLNIFLGILIPFKVISQLGLEHFSPYIKKACFL